jgi:hypothetical protein
MDIKYRKILYSFQIVTHLGRKMIEVNNNIYYYFFNIIKKNDKKLRQLKDIKKGESCYIVGNGPSLTLEDLELLKGKDCFAANLIFRLYDQTEWRPTYYFIQDRYADTGNHVDEMNVPYLFIGEYYWRKRGMKNPNAICTHTLISKDKENIDFSTDISKGIVNHWTVTYVMIQTAVYMGYQTIYLLGMDHNYALTYDENGNVVEHEDVVSHFFEDRNPQEVIANIEAMNKAYISARKYAEAHGINIYNVTRGGKLEWFERKTLEESLNEG